MHAKLTIDHFVFPASGLFSRCILWLFTSAQPRGKRPPRTIGPLGVMELPFAGYSSTLQFFKSLNPKVLFLVVWGNGMKNTSKYMKIKKQKQRTTTTKITPLCPSLFTHIHSFLISYVTVVITTADCMAYLIAALSTEGHFTSLSPLATIYLFISLVWHL